MVLFENKQPETRKTRGEGVCEKSRFRTGGWILMKEDCVGVCRVGKCTETGHGLGGGV